MNKHAVEFQKEPPETRITVGGDNHHVGFVRAHCPRCGFTIRITLSLSEFHIQRWALESSLMEEAMRKHFDLYFPACSGEPNYEQVGVFAGRCWGDLFSDSRFCIQFNTTPEPEEEEE